MSASLPRWFPPAIGAGLAVVATLLTNLVVYQSVSGAAERLRDPTAKSKPVLPTAEHAEADYCTPPFKEVLQRVLHSCGLVSEGGRRGCKPADVRTFASITDEDFNALFRPLKQRGGVILFDHAKHELDAGDQALLDKLWADRQGARYFLVVGRASKTGSTENNRALSHRRANSVLFHLQERTGDPKLEEKVGLLWLGSEFAQLDPVEFCGWSVSNTDERCGDEAINRSAFASWVDCRL